ncbi:hypothetical protein FNF29_08311 [Cafeteria roenbergensis]|uniref:Uncharacterized protein n=1 Tax=Cafeteria roenbergensis TaxID=33653 RepID=A0A5A8BZC7_CAFRO|nr:hypothetical protein FNF29_08311 [Cafeteria roenbergensis]|eukprot:KAA0145998.1 hypothetical protein FNF29_08311 [Cafeteria roenbergensis]
MNMQAKTQDAAVKMQADVHNMAMDVARRKVEDDCADAMGLMGSAFEVAHRAHAMGVRTAYRGMTAATREAADLCDMAWAAVSQTTTPSAAQPASMAHPDVRPGAMAFVQAELHYYHASTCLAANTGSDMASADLLRRRIELRKADADSFRRSLGGGREPHTSHTPYLGLLEETGDTDFAADDAATARFVARAANNYAMALFGSQKTADQAAGQLLFAMDLLFDDRVMRATLASAETQPARKAAPSTEPPKELATRLRPLWRRVDVTRDRLRTAQASDRERLTCRKMLSTSAAWLFFRSQSQPVSARDIMRVVSGDRAMVLPPMRPSSSLSSFDAGEFGAKPGTPIEKLRENLQGTDEAWLRRRGYVRLLVAIHAALEAAPTDDETNGTATARASDLPSTRALAREIIETAAEIGTAPRRIGTGTESTSGDWGTYAYLVSRCADETPTKGAKAAAPTELGEEGPRFSELGRARRFAELAARRRDGPPERSVGVAAACDADRKAIWALLKHVRAKCGLDRAGAP